MAPRKPTQTVDYMVHSGGAEKWEWEWDWNGIKDGDHDKWQTWSG